LSSERVSAHEESAFSGTVAFARGVWPLARAGFGSGASLLDAHLPRGAKHQWPRTKMKTLERTLTIVKPDAVKRNAIGDIIEQFEKKGFRILSMKMLEITKHQAEQFYAVHATKPFYHSLTEFMSSGPIVAIALEKENAIADLRELMGATNPANAKEGTIRKKWATSIEHNAIHGSDADDTARFELSFFFAGYELTQ